MGMRVICRVVGHRYGRFGPLVEGCKRCGYDPYFSMRLPKNTPERLARLQAAAAKVTPIKRRPR